MAKNKLPSKEEMVVRSFQIPDIRAQALTEGEGEGNVIEGHPAVYDQKVAIGNWFYEIIERGAFDNTDFDDVLFTVNHDWYDKIPLARSRRNNKSNKKSTMEIKTDDIGLFVRANLDVERNSEAQNLYSAVERGDIDGMSFAFYVKEETWEDLDSDMPTRRIKKISKVREVSAVNYPAYDATDINARNDQMALENAKKALDNARSSLENGKSEIEALKLRSQILMKMESEI